MKVPDTLTINTVFVYGTLRPGQYNATLWEDQPGCALIAASAYVTGEIRKWSTFSYPVFAHAPKPAEVHGALIQVSDEVLKTLDALEGVHAGFYKREVIEARTDGQSGFAWIYVFGDHSDIGRGIPIPSGDWVLDQQQAREADPRNAPPDVPRRRRSCASR